VGKQQKTAITPTREENYPEWYQQVIKAAELAENSPARGCMVIKPWGWGIWENIQKVLDRKFKETGHENAYFPLFIPKSYIEKEAEHVDGFAKECAVVTHHRLEQQEDGTLKPAGELSEPYIVRPTSETIIGEVYSKWVNSYNDLPLLINQWANVVRWEMRPRLFLRTAEFLWQEGHTVHATKEEAIEETEKMLEVYRWFAHEYLAMPVLTGKKSANERFPGAVETYCIEAMMQDGKALQAGTSHFLGQNFSKSSEIKFTDKDGQIKYAWTTSWGVSTRLIGGLIMTHSDDDGLILPPKIAPKQVVILPITKKNADNQAIYNYCEQIAEKLRSKSFDGAPIEVKIDRRDNVNTGSKSWEWIKKGVPVRVEVGPRDMEADSVFVGRRDQGVKDKKSMKREEFVEQIESILESIQQSLYERALKLRESKTVSIDNKDDFYKYFDKNIGFVETYWGGSAEDEDQIKRDLNVTIRFLDDSGSEQHTCFYSGNKTTVKAVFAKSY
jgi:prolyl-tRNA synthetase